nr:Chain P, 9-meric peptide from Serine protease/NTPase/helicase NS3 [Hepatitis C virus isolate HC-J1]
CINGMCWTV